MRNLGIDFESFYDKDLTLKKMSTSEYARHPDFEILGASVWWIGQVEAPIYLWPDELKDFFSGVDWPNTRMVSHHTLFDGFVLHTQYGHHPGKYFCTMAAAEQLLKHACRSSLDAVAKYLGVGSKIEGVLENLKGLRLANLDSVERTSLELYANEDNRLCGEIFKILYPQMRPNEIELLNITLRTFCDPRLELDVGLITEALDEAEDDRTEAIELTEHTAEDLSSNTRFVEILADVLADHGQTVPMKWSEKQQKQIPALAKSDAGMYWLLEHEDPIVRNLAEARQAVKSTIGRTRAQRMLTMATTGDGKFCPAYNFARAHTDRWTGANKMNAQNFKRKSKLRRAIRAPEGYLFLAGDLSQVEVRMNAYLAGEEWLLDLFRNGGDPYNTLASEIYDMEVDRKNGDPEHEEMGFLGKCAVLGLGFQMGAPTFKNTLAAGTLGPRKLIDIGFAEQVVQTYRRKNQRIVESWADCEEYIRYLCAGSALLEVPGGMVLDPKRKRVWMPNGTYLQYNGLTRGWDGAKYYEMKGSTKVWKSLYGGKMVENIVQKQARDVIADMALRIDPHYRVVMTTHDELGMLVPKGESGEAMAFVQKEMTTAPSWCPDLPVAAELSIAEYYSK